MYQVSAVGCDSYDEKEVYSALSEALEVIGGLDNIKQGTKVAIKANLVTFMKPERAATTHPVMLCALVKMLKEKGAEVVIGDSPGGLYTSAFVGRVYSATGMNEAVKIGASLNDDYSQEEAIFEDAKVAKRFTYTAFLDKADVIINFCKLKSHGMIGMSAAVKNMFGTIPGTIKPEYHFKYPDQSDFANMLVDLNEYFKPCLSIVDGVIGMEGNGPTQGSPRKIGVVLASKSPYLIDRVCAHIIGMKADEVPTVKASVERGLCPERLDDISIFGDVEKFVLPDFDVIKVSQSLQFYGNSAFGKLKGKLFEACLSSKPVLKASQCVGCNECGKICPAKAITMVKGKAKIDRKKCIKCFCCQEFCPKGAMKVGRTFIAKLLNK
ncbi:MAG: DUF362 domain-containing protein [Clostridia bacterium]|nr:DUF362 domain-containing protein [Clostridia bacterium]